MEKMIFLRSTYGKKSGENLIPNNTNKKLMTLLPQASSFANDRLRF